MVSLFFRFVFFSGLEALPVFAVVWVKATRSHIELDPCRSFLKLARNECEATVHKGNPGRTQPWLIDRERASHVGGEPSLLNMFGGNAPQKDPPGGSIADRHPKLATMR